MLFDWFFASHRSSNVLRIFHFSQVFALIGIVFANCWNSFRFSSDSSFRNFLIRTINSFFSLSSSLQFLDKRFRFPKISDALESLNALKHHRVHQNHQNNYPILLKLVLQDLQLHHLNQCFNLHSFTNLS